MRDHKAEEPTPQLLDCSYTVLEEEESGYTQEDEAAADSSQDEDAGFASLPCPLAPPFQSLASQGTVVRSMTMPSLQQQYTTKPFDTVHAPDVGELGYRFSQQLSSQQTSPEPGWLGSGRLSQLGSADQGLLTCSSRADKLPDKGNESTSTSMGPLHPLPHLEGWAHSRQQQVGMHGANLPPPSGSHVRHRRPTSVSDGGVLPPDSPTPQGPPQQQCKHSQPTPQFLTPTAPNPPRTGSQPNLCPPTAPLPSWHSVTVGGGSLHPIHPAHTTVWGPWAGWGPGSFSPAPVHSSLSVVATPAAWEGGSGAALPSIMASPTASQATTPVHALASDTPVQPSQLSGMLGGATRSALPQSFREYVAAEANPMAVMPTADVVWGQTERDRVYNFLLYVPYQLERLLQFGTLLCCDSLLAVVTVMPLRAGAALMQLTWHALIAARARGVKPSPTPLPGSGSSCGPALQDSQGAGQQGPGYQVAWRPHLTGSQVFDVICILILLLSTAVLRAIKPGFIYFWLKDITSEFLKMSVLSAAFEITDKILGNFGMDVLEALSGTCTLWVLGRRRGVQLAADAAVALGITVCHAACLMCQGLVLAVALNRRRQGLLALLIANNFVEIKGAVFKRWDVPRIWALACQDIVERMHLVAVLAFVVAEDMESAGSWRPSSGVLGESLRILCAEVVIDMLKHAVLGKFNDVRPGIYREYMKDLCEQAVSSQSHSLHKLLGFQHLATASLLLRVASTLFWLQIGDTKEIWWRAGWTLAAWLLLLGLKPILGYGLKRVAHKYVVSFFHAASVRRAAPTNASRMRAVAKQLAATIMPGSVPGTLTSHLTASPHRANASAQHISTQQPSTAGPSKGSGNSKVVSSRGQTARQRLRGKRGSQHGSHQPGTDSPISSPNRTKRDR